MALNLPSVDIDLLSVRRIIPFQYDYTIYNSSVMFVTDSNGELKGIELDQYFSTYGIITPSSIAPYLQSALISTTYGLTISSVNTIAYQTNSTIIAEMWPSTNAYLYSTILSTCISTILRVDANLSSLSSFVRITNCAPGTSSLSTNLASLSNITLIGLSTLSTSFGNTTTSTISTFYGALSNGLVSINTGAGVSSISTSISENFSSMSTVLSVNPIGITGVSSLSTILFTYMSSMSAGDGVSTLSTVTARSFFQFRYAPGLSSLSTVVSQSISTYSTSIGRNPPGITGVSSLSTGTALKFVQYDCGPGTSSLSTNLVNFLCSFSTSIYSNPPGITGLSSLLIEVQYGFSTLSAGDGVSSLSTIIGPGISSVDSSYGLSSLSTAVSLGLSSVSASFGLSSLSTSLSMGFSTVAAGPGISSLSTIISLGLSSVACSSGLSSLSTVVSLGLSTVGNSIAISTLSSYIFSLSTVDLQFSGYFDYISDIRFLHRITDKPALGLNCIPDSATTLDVNGLTHFRSTTYFTGAKVGINKLYNTDLNGELDVSGSILAENLFINQIGIFGESVTAQEFLTPSDERLKENIKIIENSISSIQQMRGVTFQWRASQRNDIGFIAQEVSRVIPEAVQKHSSESYLVVAYEKIIPVLIEGIKQLTERVENLERIVHSTKK